MKRRVVKFGGSNLKSRNDICRMVEIVKKYEEPPVIVVSALYGITDLIKKSLEEIISHEKEIDILLNDLSEKHLMLIDSQIHDLNIRKLAIKIFSEHIEKMEKLLLAVHYLGSVPLNVEDSILSFGERFSAQIINGLFIDRGIESILLYPEDIGFVTDGCFGEAVIDFDCSVDQVRKALDIYSVIVIPGFYGISKSGEVTLLGRGGSDYSAAGIAACIGSESLDLWKDVPGFLSGDPRLIRDTVTVEKLSYSEAAELSYFGAGIIHPQTIWPMKLHNIPIRIFNIYSFCSEITPDTIINADIVKQKNVIKSITSSDDLGIFKLIGSGVGIKHGILANITGEMNRYGINIKSVITSQTSINILLGKVIAKVS